MGAVCDAHRFDAGNGSSFGARLRNLTDLGRVLAPPITRFTRKAAARVACSSARRSVATDPRSPLLPVDELFSALDAMTRRDGARITAHLAGEPENSDRRDTN